MSIDATRLELSFGRSARILCAAPVTGAIVQELPQPSAFIGLAFSPDAQTLESSGGNQDVVYRKPYLFSNTSPLYLGLDRTMRRASGRVLKAGEETAARDAAWVTSCV